MPPIIVLHLSTLWKKDHLSLLLKPSTWQPLVTGLPKCHHSTRAIMCRASIVIGDKRTYTNFCHNETSLILPLTHKYASTRHPNKPKWRRGRVSASNSCANIQQTIALKHVMPLSNCQLLAWKLFKFPKKRLMIVWQCIAVKICHVVRLLCSAEVSISVLL